MIENTYNLFYFYKPLNEWLIFMTTIDKADHVLDIIYNHRKINEPYLNSEIRLVRDRSNNMDIEMINPVEREGIIDMLIADNYIKKITSDGSTNFQITLQGAFFVEKGGYNAFFARQSQLETLQMAVLQNDKVVTRLTWILALTASVTAVHDLIDIFEPHPSLVNMEVLASLFLFLAGGLFVACIILIKAQVKQTLKHKK